MSVARAELPPADTRSRWRPSGPLITTRLLELRKRTGLMVAVLLLTVGLPVIFLGIRLLLHLVDPSSYGPAGSPGVFTGTADALGTFGFIAAAVVGTSAGTTDLSDGVFRHLVITGRSRLALYFARLPAGLAIVLPMVAVAFTMICLVTAYAGTNESRISFHGVSVPAQMTESEFATWIEDHAKEVENAGAGASIPRLTGGGLTELYTAYRAAEADDVGPSGSEMAKIGLWIELNTLIGFTVGLGLGSLLGQRTVSTVLMIVLEFVVTPIAVNVSIPYFLNAQRLLVGVPMTQLRPADLVSTPGASGHGRALVGGRALGIPPMPTWAMVAVIVGWVVGWTVIGAWRMGRREA